MLTDTFRGALGALALVLCFGCSTMTAYETVAPAAYRSAMGPVTPAADGNLYLEAEEFATLSREPCWMPRVWGENYYAATFANTFLSRQRYLEAPEQAAGSATIALRVAEPGDYLVLARYEAPYRFETRFRIVVEQDGKVVLDRLYGARENLKIWAFRQKLKTELAWSWGATENLVWEGHEAIATLATGEATVTLIAAPQPEPAARRNVDLIMLTRDREEVARRIEKENYLPLDGLLTQQGDLYLRLTNPATNRAPAKLTWKPGTQHSPYWIHLRNWPATAATPEIAPGVTSDWIEVGHMLDSLNSGQWNLVGPDRPYTVEFAVPGPGGTLTPIASFASPGGTLELAYSGNTRYRHRLIRRDQVLADLVAAIEAEPIPGALPRRFPVYGYSFDSREGQAEFARLFGLQSARGSIDSSYIDVRHHKTLAALEAWLKGLSEEQRTTIRVVSLGDEIGIPAPSPKDPATHQRFRAWLAAEKAPIAPVDYDVSTEAAKARPEQYYWSRRFAHADGLSQLKARTDLLRRYLPNAQMGANYSPHHGGAAMAYMGEVHQWVHCFRREAMTMPWSEDYAWQLPIASPQLTALGLDLFRAGIRHRPDAPIHWYVMPHAPGTTPRMWRRQFYTALGHGMKILNLFEFRPVEVAYTENYCNNPDTYIAVRRALHEVATCEDFVLDGTVRASKIAFWFSEASDIWHDNEPPYGAAKRALYLAMRHQLGPVDIVIEEDALDGTLDQYAVLVVADRHVSRQAAAVLDAWAKRGGKLFLTAGAATLDEYNRPNEVLAARTTPELTTLPDIQYVKQDLPFVELDEAARAAFPGLAYFVPAIPRRPVDRGSTDDAFCHFLPTEFDPAVAATIRALGDGVPRDLVTSDPLVDATLIDSPHGTLVVLANWRPTPIAGLTVTVRAGHPVKGARLASGGAVTIAVDGGTTVLNLDLDVGDAIMLSR